MQRRGKIEDYFLIGLDFLIFDSNMEITRLGWQKLVFCQADIFLFIDKLDFTDFQLVSLIFSLINLELEL